MTSPADPLKAALAEVERRKKEVQAAESKEASGDGLEDPKPEAGKKEPLANDVREKLAGRSAGNLWRLRRHAKTIVPAACSSLRSKDDFLGLPDDDLRGHSGELERLVREHAPIADVETRTNALKAFLYLVSHPDHGVVFLGAAKVIFDDLVKAQGQVKGAEGQRKGLQKVLRDALARDVYEFWELVKGVLPGEGEGLDPSRGKVEVDEIDPTLPLKTSETATRPPKEEPTGVPQDVYDVMRGRVEELKNQLEAARQQIADMVPKDDLTAVESERDQLRAQVAQLITKTGELEHQLQTLQDEHMDCVPADDAAAQVAAAQKPLQEQITRLEGERDSRPTAAAVQEQVVAAREEEQRITKWWQHAFWIAVGVAIIATVCAVGYYNQSSNNARIANEWYYAAREAGLVQ